MPVMLGGYTVLSLALIGIPPCSGFVSKWYLACGALASGTGVWTIAGPAVLLISALLTAGYLLPLTIHGFFPGEDFDESELKARAYRAGTVALHDGTDTDIYGGGPAFRLLPGPVPGYAGIHCRGRTLTEEYV